MGITWKQRLGAAISEAMGREIDVFETQIELRRQGKIEEKLFAETRLRRGTYGQRYDNGQRHDGKQTQQLSFPCGTLTKGPNTVWDAPGMQRIKIPLGHLRADQLDVLAELAEEYSDGIAHVTTRQDFQLHFVHLEDTPDLMRRLAAVGITTREACGNTVRNVTACPLAGVCGGEAFDVTPHAYACAYFLLGHPDTQDFGRKFKIAFSGCAQHACGLARMNDLGIVAAVREGQRVFDVYIGGGLGAVPHQAKLLASSVAEEELLPLTQAVARVFARLGERKNRQRARLKFLVAKLGIDELARLVREEREALRPDQRWTAFLGDPSATSDGPLRPPGALPVGPHPPGFEAWRATNTVPQRQPGYAVATVRLPLGDLTSAQLRALADLARRFTGDTVRATMEQNLAFRWVSEADLPAFFEGLVAAGLALAGASTLTDITACPGTDTCKLGISSSRGLAAALTAHFEGRALDPALQALHIKTSGCFNSCGQHHLADIGLMGVSRSADGRRVPHFQLVLGGETRGNASAYGLAVAAVPSKNVPAAVERLTGAFVRDRRPDETFAAFIQRIGKAAVRQMIEDLLVVPAYDKDPSYYSDWGDPREYTITDMGQGECAGELVSVTKFGLANSELEVFEAQLFLDRGEAGSAAQRAYSAMLQAAKALVRAQTMDIGDDPAEIMRQFQTRILDTGVFADPYAGDKFATYLLRLHGTDLTDVSHEQARQCVEEATLFIEAAHACYHRISAALARTP